MSALGHELVYDTADGNRVFPTWDTVAMACSCGHARYGGTPDDVHELHIQHVRSVAA